jgi:hypothetical protein
MNPTPPQGKRYQKAIDEHRRLEKIVTEIEASSLAILEQTTPKRHKAQTHTVMMLTPYLSAVPECPLFEVDVNDRDGPERQQEVFAELVPVQGFSFEECNGVNVPADPFLGLSFTHGALKHACCPHCTVAGDNIPYIHT